MKSVKQKDIRHVSFGDIYYPCMPPRYPVSVLYSDDTVESKTLELAEIYHDYRQFFSEEEQLTLTRRFDALPRMFQKTTKERMQSFFVAKAQEPVASVDHSKTDTCDTADESNTAGLK